MVDTAPDKPSLLSRLFGRKPDEPKRDDAPAEGPASASEGVPDFATAAAAGEMTRAAPTATAASPELSSAQKLPPELAGADLQPVEGKAPEVRGADPAGSSPPSATAPSNWWRRLTEGMRRTSSSLGENVTTLFTDRRRDAVTLEHLEDALVQADLGIDTAARIAEAIGQGRYNKEIAPDEVKAILAGEVEKVLGPVARPLHIDRTKKPFV